MADKFNFILGINNCIIWEGTCVMFDVAEFQLRILKFIIYLRKLISF